MHMYEHETFEYSDLTLVVCLCVVLCVCVSTAIILYCALVPSIDSKEFPATVLYQVFPPTDPDAE